MYVCRSTCTCGYTKVAVLNSVVQDRGVILSRREHGQHHCSPFEGHYCILTGRANRWLDHSHFFRRMEKIVFHVTGATAHPLYSHPSYIHTYIHACCIGNRPITWNEDPEIEKLAMSMKILPW